MESKINLDKVGKKKKNENKKKTNHLNFFRSLLSLLIRLERYQLMKIDYDMMKKN